MKKLYTLLFIILFSSLSHGSSLEDALALAEEKNLAQEHYWRVLLHYRDGWVMSDRSLVDDPKFFLSPNGKTDRTAELVATIEALLKPDSGEPDSHATCRFPARAAWLKDELGLEYPTAACPKFDIATENIQPASASVVFPFSSMADPASMFGHTMLRLEKANSSPLLGYAVSYAADARDAGPMQYIVFGIGGGFDGQYSVLPYSSKLNEYTSIDMRDIWEYRLNFTPDEVYRMYLHIWEMSLVLQDYYFFDENCAFNLLFFIEAARPGIALTDEFTVALPVNTIKMLTDLGLVREIDFRPSHVKKLHTIAESLNYSQISLAKDIADGDEDPASILELSLPDTMKATILDLSAELLRYYHKSMTEDSELADYRKRSVAILMQRSKIPLANNYDVPRPAIAPEEAHNSRRVLVGAGYGYDSPFIDVGYRFTNHSLEDNTNGYVDGMEVVALDINGRYYTDTEHFSLNELVIVDVVNLKPMTRLFKSSSWILASGMEDRSLSAEDNDYVWYMNSSLGATLSITNGSYIWLTAMFETQLSAKREPNFGAGIGPRGGFVLRTGTFGSLVLEGRYLWYTGSNEHTESLVSAQYAWHPFINHALVAEASYASQYEHDGSEYSLSYRYFF